ncbi:MAG: cell shape determination protein CcmA [Betaproteobacteria bacterium]|nr:cell shape determination protein CcmA [Betaproteobacteria bacterium]
MLQRDTFFGRNPQKTPDVPNTAAAAVTNASPSARPAAASNAPSPEETRRLAAKPPSAKPGESQGSQLIVGPNIKLKGVEITDCDTLVVEGHVEATMDSRMIQIAQHGTFSGTAGIDIAEIHGGFSGELTVRKCLTIHATGQVTGKIRYGKLVIEEGGELAGDIKKLGDDEKGLRIQHVSSGGRTALSQGS